MEFCRHTDTPGCEAARETRCTDVLAALLALLAQAGLPPGHEGVSRLVADTTVLSPSSFSNPFDSFSLRNATLAQLIYASLSGYSFVVGAPAHADPSPHSC